ncbi:MAG: hypothetical protein WCJ33_09310, partial [Pseudomonadota bacterium]
GKHTPSPQPLPFNEWIKFIYNQKQNKMKTKTIITTTEVIDLTSIEFPCYTKIDGNITKHISETVCITACKDGSINIQNFQVTKTFRFDELEGNKTIEATKEEFDSAYFRAIELTKEFI